MCIRLCQMTTPLLLPAELAQDDPAVDAEGLSPNSQIRQQKASAAALQQEDATAPGGGGYKEDPAPSAPSATEPSPAQADVAEDPLSLPVIKPHHKEVEKKVLKYVDDTEPTFLYITVNKIRGLIVGEEELEAVVTCIFKMVMHDKMDGHHGMRCGETYADITCSLRSAVPPFPIPAGALAGTKAMTFTRMLLNVTQDTFEARCNEFKSVEARNDSVMLAKVAHCLTALVAFIGHLFVRKLIAQRVLAQVVHELIGVRDKQPDKHLILCACELMQVIGRAIDETNQGTMLMTQFLARLSNLAALRNKDSQKATYPEEIRDAIRAVHEARFIQWPARGGSQVLVQYHEVPLDTAKTLFTTLENDQALPPRGDRKCRDAPTVEDTASGLVHLKISAVISGRAIAVVFSKTPAELTEGVLKDEISYLTGIHAERLMVFKPDLTLLEDLSKAPARK